ncbi:olfactory receptor 2AP1-like [Alligator sinensis]|uniref:Olfactory receptor n=1 Tax=Alligator sinensis TaxID=38654 RepID=A0A3Q0FVE0_ALLSI|nr:olfactory receptor 2AP1-like [Alligator sinensis]
MAETEWGNQTVIFLLLGFGNVPELQILLFPLFLTTYIVTVSGNILIIVLVVGDHHLHNPMYFFLGNLSCLETCYTTNILPRMLASFLTGDRTISVRSCTTQFYFFGFLAATECCLLATMSYDRYVAICKPLHYASLMNNRLCIQLITASWMNGFLCISIVMCLMSQMQFCGPNDIDHFFCDFTPLIRLSCNETHLVEILAFLFSSILTLPSFLLILISYVCIIGTILRIPSTIGRQKAFSTCSSHLIVVTLFYGTLIAVYLLPKTTRLRALNKVFSIFYTVLTPMVNPLIYSLSNKEVHETLRKAAKKLNESFSTYFFPH